MNQFSNQIQAEQKKPKAPLPKDFPNPVAARLGTCGTNQTAYYDMRKSKTIYSPIWTALTEVETCHCLPKTANKCLYFVTEERIKSQVVYAEIYDETGQKTIQVKYLRKNTLCARLV